MAELTGASAIWASLNPAGIDSVVAKNTMQNTDSPTVGSDKETGDNGTLNKARKRKDNEYFTRWFDIETEIMGNPALGVRGFADQFRGKVVLCPCDSVHESYFWAFFHKNFTKLGLKKLMCSFKPNLEKDVNARTPVIFIYDEASRNRELASYRDKVCGDAYRTHYSRRYERLAAMSEVERIALANSYNPDDKLTVGYAKPLVEDIEYTSFHKSIYEDAIIECPKSNKKKWATMTDEERSAKISDYIAKKEKEANKFAAGDFRSADMQQYFDEADIIVTNPPFGGGLFMDLVNITLSHSKDFLIIGNIMAPTYKDFFPLIRDDKVRLGYNFGPSSLKMYFRVGAINVAELLRYDDPAFTDENTEYNRRLDLQQSAEEAAIAVKSRVEDLTDRGSGTTLFIPNADNCKTGYKRNFTVNEYGYSFALVTAWWYTTFPVDRSSFNYFDVSNDCRYSAAQNPTYDNYDAVEVTGFKDVPSDYFESFVLPTSFKSVLEASTRFDNITLKQFNKTVSVVTSTGNYCYLEIASQLIIPVSAATKDSILQLLSTIGVPFDSIAYRNGVMGAPSNYMVYHNPEQFDLVAFRVAPDNTVFITTREEEREFNIGILSEHNSCSRIIGSTGEAEWRNYTAESANTKKNEVIDVFFPELSIKAGYDRTYIDQNRQQWRAFIKRRVV